MGSMLLAALLVASAIVIPGTAALANTSGAITVIPNGPTTQVVNSDFRTTVSWSCSGGQATACENVEIRIPITLDAPAGAIEEMDLWGMNVTLPSSSVAGFTQTITRSATSALVTLRATRTIPAGTQENFVVTVRPHGATGDGVGFTVGAAELTSPSFITVTSDEIDYTVTARDLLPPEKLYIGGGPGSTAGTMVATYQISPNVRAVWDPVTDAWSACVNQIALHTNQNVTAVASTLQIVDILPAGSTFLSATGGGVYDPASHTVTWSSCSNLSDLPFIVRVEIPSVTDEANAGFVPDVTNTLERRFTDTSGIDHVDTDTAVHSNLLIDRPGALIGKCGNGRFNLPPGTPNPGGQCLPFRASVPYGYTGPGNNVATHFYSISASRLLDRDVVTFTDWLPCLDTPITGSTPEAYASSPGCANPSAALHSITVQRVPTTGATTSIGLQRLVLHLSDGTSEVYDGATRPIPNLAALPQFGSLLIVGFEATTQPMSGAGRITLSMEARLQPAVDRAMHLHNTAQVRVENAGMNYAFTGEATGIGVVRNMVGGTSFVQFTGTSANRQLLASMTVSGLDPSTGLPSYTVVLPAGYEPRGGDTSNVQLTLSAPHASATSDYLVTYIPEDLNAGTPGRIVITAQPGTTSIPATSSDAWPHIGVRITIDPTYGSPFGWLNAESITSVNGGTVQIGGCVFGGYRANDPNDLDADGMTTGDSSCVGATGNSFPPTNIVPTSVLTKLVRDPQTNTWSGGNSVAVSGSGTAEYLLRWENGGQPALSNIVLYDLLPAPGDTGALTGNASDPRGSDFAPVFTGVISQSATNNVVVAYSAQANPCRPEVFPTNPGCVNDWTVDPADLGGIDQVRALRVQLNGSWAGGSNFTLRFGVDLPPNTASSEIAWNTLAGRALLGTEPLVAAESARTGVRAPSSVVVEKSSPQAGQTVRVGDTLEYLITATNTLDTRADNVRIVDDLSDVLQVASYGGDAEATIGGVPSGTIQFNPLTGQLVWEGDLGAQETVDIRLTLQVNEVSAQGGVVNTVIGTVGDDPTNCVTGTEPECTVVVTTVNPRIEIDKFSADVAEGDTVFVDTQVTWTYRVTNPGAETIENVVVTDSRGVAVTCPATELTPGAWMDCTGTGSVGSATPYQNVGIVTGEGSFSGQAVTANDPWEVNVRMPDPAILLEKTSSTVTEGSTVNAETIVDWTYTVTNTGEEPLVIVRVTDDQGVIVTCPVAELAVGESTVCTGSGSVGFGPSYTNVGLAEGVGSVSATPVSSSDPWTVTVTPYDIGLTIDKTAPGHPETGWVRPNTVIDWEYLVTNVGEEPVDTIAVTDDQGVAVTCPVDELAPGASMICTGAGSVGAGPTYTNLGTVTGTSALTNTPLTDDDPWSITVREPVAEISIVKGATNAVEGGTAPANHVVDWQYTVVNLGEESLVGMTVTDDQGVMVTCPGDTLGVGETMVCTGSGSIGTAASYENLGTVVATGELSGTPVTAEDPWGIAIDRPDALVTIIKDAQGHGLGDVVFAGTEMTWSYTVVNVGGQPLVDLSVVDDQGVVVTCPTASLGVGESMVCTGSGSVGAGPEYRNLGTVTGTSAWTNTPVTSEDPWETAITTPIVTAGPGPGAPSDPPTSQPTSPLAVTGSASSTPVFIVIGGSLLLVAGGLILLLRKRRVTVDRTPSNSSPSA
ncbi:DUF7507 domain-containing protein [Leucobacter sp. W1478]|uniref:DUF7507 domain-containing protein n=1 Tax=Leucobacter sp. W1478 TaxID=3439065 RepID=UPI003F388760